jgi:threonine dehydrogenase-like Zn-dependent dehydrogenase
MRALIWNGVNDLRVATVKDPEIVNPHDAILRVTMSTTCGSDLHFIDGYIPTMKAGDVIGHEFMGVVEEVGPEVKKVKKGDRAGGRGPDACIDAVGMEAHGTGLQYAYDRVKQFTYMETDRGEALREAIIACRKGGTLSILGVYGVMDKFPIGAIMNKGLTVRTAQQHGQAYMKRLLDHAQKGELNPSFLATHRFSLEDAPRGYELFKHKQDGCVRSVFTP